LVGDQIGGQPAGGRVEEYRSRQQEATAKPVGLILLVGAAREEHIVAHALGDSHLMAEHQMRKLVSGVGPPPTGAYDRIQNDDRTVREQERAGREGERLDVVDLLEPRAWHEVVGHHDTGAEGLRESLGCRIWFPRRSRDLARPSRLEKNPGGYECHTATGVACPIGLSVP